MVLVALLALTASGALDQSVGSTPGSAPGTETATAECATDLLLTDDGTEQVTPKQPPTERPELAPEAVARFAREYERAFAHNHELDERTRDVTVELQGATVKSVGGGLPIRIYVWTRTTVDAGTVDGSSEDTAVRESFYDAHYFVSETALRHTETDRHGSLPDADRSESGVTLACWR